MAFYTTIKQAPNKIKINEQDENIVDLLHDLPVNTNLDLINEDVSTSAITDQDKLLRWHFRLGHLSFRKMRILMLLGILPKKLLKVKPPMCAGCKVGAMTKRPWRVKGDTKSGKLRKVKAPGECVFVNQLESRTPGFLGVLRGFITKKRYTCAIIFVDHFSGFTYVYLQSFTDTEETLKAKRAFQVYSESLGVKILHYYADNDRFTDKRFMHAVTTEGQYISFCGVNSHFQNGKAEKRIRDLTDQARKMVLYAIHK